MSISINLLSKCNAEELLEFEKQNKIFLKR